jgi:hypothetical protein
VLAAVLGVLLHIHMAALMVRNLNAPTSESYWKFEQQEGIEEGVTGSSEMPYPQYPDCCL